MPPGDIKALGVQLPSQPPLPPGEQELGRCLLLLWLETSTNAVPLLGRDFHVFPFSLSEQEHFDPLHVSAKGQVFF